MIEYMEEKIKVVLYARVSTSAQDYTRQITELRKFAKKQNYEIVKEFSEKISGGKKIDERAAIKELLDFVKSNKVDKVLVYECSRLSRRQLDFLSIIEQLTEAGVSLYILQNGLETLLPDGKSNPIANLCFGIIAEFNNLKKISLGRECPAAMSIIEVQAVVWEEKRGIEKVMMNTEQLMTERLLCCQKAILLKMLE